MSVKLYYNTTAEDMNVIGIGLIPAGEKVSVASEFQPHVVLENYPGLTEVSEESVTVEDDEATTDEPKTDSDEVNEDVKG